MNTDHIEASKAFVKNIFDESTEQSLFYHDWIHTTLVFKATEVIAENTDAVSESDKEVLVLAAIFHDVAYNFGSEQHEKDSAEIAEKFLAERSYDEAKITLLKRIVMATKVGYQPADILEKVIKDADVVHIGHPAYITTTYGTLFKEVKAKYNPEMTKGQWAGMCSEFMHKHQFHTEYAKATYGPSKIENLALVDELAKAAAAKAAAPKEPKAEKKKSKKKDEKAKPKGKPKSDLPEKGIETMFRVSLRNHMTLSRIADNKANTLISVNGIIISIVLSALFPKMDSNPFLIYPGLSLIIFSIVTIIFAILSTIPKTTHGKISRKEVGEKKGNLIFFGNFHDMSLNDYEWGIGELMKDKDYLYKSLTRDLYFLGKVLNRKYSLLRWSYYTFVVGLVVTIALFVLSIQSLPATI
jgi:predicted metal-dependent HD superfamily phosphohydrolase